MHSRLPMHLSWLAVLVVITDLAVPARAEPAPSHLESWTAAGALASEEGPSSDEPAPGQRPRLQGGTADSAGPRFALGVSSPTGWIRRSLGVSVYVGAGRHHAVRANVARYDAEELLPLVFTLFERVPRTGDVLDLGLSSVWYSRGLWDGLMFEAGALRRERDVRVHPGGGEKNTTRSVTYAGRVTLGWSWLFAQRMFIAFSAGVSVGRESGHETSARDFTMPVTRPIDRSRVDAEVYLRFGIAFGD